MGELLVPSDPVKLAISWLDGAYPWAVTVTKNRPNPTAGRVVTVRRGGGSQLELHVVDSAWLTVECFAPTDEQASDLAHYTWGLLFAMAREVIDGVQCYRVQPIGAPVDMPDTEAQIPRFVMTVQAQFRARSADIGSV
jgi:hypothetical protein